MRLQTKSRPAYQRIYTTRIHIHLHWNVVDRSYTVWCSTIYVIHDARFALENGQANLIYSKHVNKEETETVLKGTEMR